MTSERPVDCVDSEVEFGVLGIQRLLGTDRIRSGDIVALTGAGKSKTLLGVHYLLAREDPGGRGRASLHELPNMATHREKLRAIHAADDITNDGCQYACRC